MHPELMRIDVELSGQLFIMRRREQHLENVLACLSALTQRLSETNSSVRQDYTAQLAAIDEVKTHATVLQDIEAARARTDAVTQEVNALAYESAQFLVDDLWHMAAAPRQKVLAMRERVFGTGRRLPQGVSGAHGRFNRLQWTNDGTGRLVDVYGRTESEAEEEEDLPPIRPVILEDEGDAVEHASLKPTWLLKIFNYWGSRWGTTKAADGQAKETSKERQEPGRERTQSISVTASTTALELRSSLVRNHTA